MMGRLKSDQSQLFYDATQALNLSVGASGTWRRSTAVNELLRIAHKQNRPPAFADGRLFAVRPGGGTEPEALGFRKLTPGADRPGAGPGAGDVAT